MTLRLYFMGACDKLTKELIIAYKLQFYLHHHKSLKKEKFIVGTKKAFKYIKRK